MRKIEKPGVCDDDSYFSYLPDEIVLLILNKIIDLKTLCLRKVVSTQFSLIVHQANTISFVASRADNPSYDLNPSDDDELPKKLLHFLSFPFYNPLRGPTEELRAPAADLWLKKLQWAFDCMMDAAVGFCTIDFPLLEKVLIMQSGKRGSVSIIGEDIVEMRNWLRSPTDSLEQKLSDSMDLSSVVYRWYVPLLKLPVLGYLMKGVTLYMFLRKDLLDGDDSFMKINLDDDFEDKEEASYGEARC